MHKIITLLLLALLPVVAKAQFTIVDSESGEVIPGAYVFGENGSLLGMSNDKGVVEGATGKVTLSMLSYEPLTVDATGLTGEVKLTAQPFALNEATVGKPEYLKISGTFRDVVTNSGKLVMYREGIMDFYYNTSSKKWTRRIRAARQFEHPNLRKMAYIDSLYSGVNRLFDLGHVREIEAEKGEERGDTITLALASKKGNAMVTDAGMVYKHGGLYHVVIDGIKVSGNCRINIFGSTLEFKARLTDWAYTDPTMTTASLAAYRYYAVEANRSARKSPTILADKMNDFVVTDIVCLTRDEAKEEMKDKERAEDFKMPNNLPAIPAAILEQIPLLKPTKLREM